HPGRAARRAAADGHRPGARNPHRARARRADARRASVGQRDALRPAAPARAVPGARGGRRAAPEAGRDRRRSHDADGSARAACGAEEGAMSVVKAPVRRRDVLTSLRQPKVAVMLMLGFSSGLPFFLTGNTLGYWLRDAGTTLT